MQHAQNKGDKLVEVEKRKRESVGFVEQENYNEMRREEEMKEEHAVVTRANDVRAKKWHMQTRFEQSKCLT